MKMIMNNNKRRGEYFSPNSNSSPPLKDLVGKVITKESKKVYVKTSPFLGNTYLKLKIISEQEQKKNLFVYSNVVSKEIFHQIAKNDCIDKRYLFTCQKKGRR